MINLVPPTVYKKHYPPALNDEVWRLEKIETESSTQMTLFLTIRSLVKRAYDNWMHVIEYDGRSLPDLKQNQGVIASQNDVPSCKLVPSFFVCLVAHSESSLILLSLQTITMFDAISLPLQNLLVNTSQKIQAPGTDNLQKPRRARAESSFGNGWSAETAQLSQPSEFTTVRVLELEEKQLQ
uniref:Uncharacterized protein n=1 Tax=Salix viminalis TaxID=40686 RepID=A0A6N2LCY9_SALVM